VKKIVDEKIEELKAKKRGPEAINRLFTIL
jgi:hypothetical protein